MPHLLVAGTTGAGKSGCVNAMLSSILLRATPDQVRLVLVDPKQVELNHYEAIPHLLTPVITSPRMAANALQNLVARDGVALRRSCRVARTRIARRAQQAPRPRPATTPLPYILCVIDELADLMMVAPADVEDSIIRLAQKARAVGIHLVLATQSPRVDVITGMIKANVPSRIAFAVSSQTDSRVILDQNGAESLLGQGDMLFSRGRLLASSSASRAPTSTSRRSPRSPSSGPRRASPQLREDLLEEVEPEAGAETGDHGDFDPDEDPLLDDAIQLVVEMGTASTSMLQRRLRLGYTRAGRLIDMLERRGIISGYEGSKPRQVLVTEADLPRVLAALEGSRRPSRRTSSFRSPRAAAGRRRGRPRLAFASRCPGSAPACARRECASASTSRRPRRTPRSAASTCARSRTRSGRCCPGRRSSRASCAPTRTTWASTGASLVEEFKLKFERPEMQAIAPPRPARAGPRRQRGGRGGPPGRRAALARRSRSSRVVLVGPLRPRARRRRGRRRTTARRRRRRRAHDAPTSERGRRRADGAARGRASRR